VQRPQIERHVARLDQSTETASLLLVLTPDDSRPTILDELNDERIAWSSFALLDQAIDELLDDSKEVVSEREAFLLRELKAMLEAEGLLANPNDTVVVAARTQCVAGVQRHTCLCLPAESIFPAGLPSRLLLKGGHLSACAENCGNT
jgi:hypothetical protein